MNLLKIFRNALKNLRMIKNDKQILGDTNNNVMKSDKRTPQADRYLQALTSNRAQSLITKPKRVTDKTATIIDHIMTNDVDHKLNPFIIPSLIADHYVIACKITKFKAIKNKVTIPQYRDKKTFCSETLDQELGNLVSQHFSLTTDNFDCLFDQFAFVISNTIDKHAPLKNMSRKELLITVMAQLLKSNFFKIFQFYLSNRKQNVSLKQNRPEIKTISYGVSQGSSLGPLFVFFVYVNDLNNALNCIPRLFADDTCLTLKSLDPKLLQNEMNTELEKLQQWCCANKLTINPIKTIILIIPPKCFDTSTLSLNITSNNAPVNVVSSTKYLGVIFDNKLEFKEHIKTLENNVARAVGILTKLKYIFPNTTLSKLYFALMHPIISYGIIIWGDTYPTYLQKLQTLQNEALRVITGSHYQAEANLIYRHLEVLKMKDFYKFKVAKFVYCCINKKASTLF